MPFPLTYFRTPPPFTIWHSHPNQPSRVLITAGIDGDEYQAIHLAQQLIKTYNLNIPITVIPIVNLAGYSSITSYNPLDHRYPKYIFPGSPYGSSSSRLMYQISLIAQQHDLWIDLHCGAIDEILLPFAWASQAYSPLSYLNTRVLIEKSVDKKMPYIILEHGEIDWVLTIINSLNKPLKNNWRPTYTHIKYEKNLEQKIDSNMLWYSPTIFVTAS